MLGKMEVLKSYDEQTKQPFVRLSLQILTEYHCGWKYVVRSKFKGK